MSDIEARDRVFTMARDADVILYCHGFGSYFDPTKDKTMVLAELHPVIGITVDYTKPPRRVFDEYAKLLKGGSKPLIVGTSLGGYFAAWLGAELNLPFIAINPAIAPHKSLLTYIGLGQTYFGQPYEMSKTVTDMYRNLPFRTDGAGVVVLDMGDKVLNPWHTVDTARNHQMPLVTFSNGSHRFDHMPELLSMIKFHVDPDCLYDRIKKGGSLSREDTPIMLGLIETGKLKLDTQKSDDGEE